MMSLWDALRMNMMISYQELVRTFPSSFRPNDLSQFPKLIPSAFAAASNCAFNSGVIRI
ncbi:Uncharacterised protein [Enterobacter hormaechei]|nr:Uncharacterised protein [Enterobacter hormaechei]